MNNKQQHFAESPNIKFTKVNVIKRFIVMKEYITIIHMNRTTNKLSSKKRHKKIIKLSKSCKGSLSNLFIAANQTVLKALKNSYKGRKDKKRLYVKLWTNRINATCRNNNTTYTLLKEKIHKKNIDLNRKIIAKISNIDDEMVKKLIMINN